MGENKTILRLKDTVNSNLYTLLINSSILFLTVNKKWYQKIASQEKKEEYREIKPYYIKRFFLWKNEPNWGINDFVREFVYHENELGFIEKHSKDFDIIIFINGYGNKPTMIVEHKGMDIKSGKEEWGAIGSNFYFTLTLGKILYSEPCG